MEEMRMAYEYIVRKANGWCERYGVAGADADIFDGFVRNWCKDREGKYIYSEFKRGYAIGVISAYLSDALERLQKDESLSEENKAHLKEIGETLFNPEYKDIVKAITDTAELLQF